MTKQERTIWQQAKQETARITDALGMPIDTGILEMVTILRLMGFTTTSSCQGHVSRFLTEPYVRVESPAGRNYAQLAQELPDATKRNPAYARLRKTAVQHTLREAQRLTGYLDEFYRDRDTDYRRSLTVRFFPPTLLNLVCLGVERMHIANSQDKREILNAARNEFAAFTEFLLVTHFGNKNATISGGQPAK
jgi:hypothetical protein